MVWYGGDGVTFTPLPQVTQDELQRLREELQEEFFRETAREDRDAWSKGFSHGLRVALEKIEKRMGEVDM